MNVSSFMGLQTTLRGLLAQQRGLDVTTHNIGNANTVGYTRQEATLVAANAMQLGASGTASGSGAYLGQGVEVEEYRRLRDGFLDVQYRGQAMAHNQYAATAGTLATVEAGLAEPGANGINALLGKFWSAWSDVANNPESDPAKQALIGNAQSLVSAIKTLDTRLSDVATQATAEYGRIMNASGPVVAAGKELASIDKAISDAVTAGRAPNDLLDRRDTLLDDLATYGQVSVTDLGNGSIRVQFGDSTAAPLTNGSAFGWGDTTAAAWAPPAMTAPGGKLGALIGVGPQIASYRAQLNGVAASLATNVNAAHGTSPSFFTVTAGAEASTLSLGATALTVRTGSSGSGSNDIALAIAGLRGGTADVAYSDLIGRIGSDTANAERQRDTTAALVQTADARRQELSGVSMDEEMTNMIRFQRGYQASARAMSTVDELLDTLINRTGRVGL
jgi:flagellar hook-associated protein 1 FlgK